MPRRGEDPSRFPSIGRARSPCIARHIFGSYGTAALNGPIAYLPSIVTVALLRIVDAPIPLIFFAGRLATLLAFVGIYYLAIRLIPVGKQVLFVLGLFPTTLLLASSYSADPMPIALAVLAISLTLAGPSHRGARPPHLPLPLSLSSQPCRSRSPRCSSLLRFYSWSRHPGLARGASTPVILQASAAVVVVVLAGLWSLATRHSKLQFGLWPESAQASRIHSPRPVRLCLGPRTHVLREHGRGALAARIRLLDWFSPPLGSRQYLRASRIGDRRCVDVVVRLSAAVW